MQRSSGVFSEPPHRSLTVDDPCAAAAASGERLVILINIMTRWVGGTGGPCMQRLAGWLAGCLATSDLCSEPACLPAVPGAPSIMVWQQSAAPLQWWELQGEPEREIQREREESWGRGSHQDAQPQPETSSHWQHQHQQHCSSSKRWLEIKQEAQSGLLQPIERDIHIKRLIEVHLTRAS